MEKLNYKHLSSEERDRIAFLRAQGKSVLDIAESIRRNKGTISRELKRNRSPIYNVYLANKAHERAVKRKHESVQRQRIRNPLIRRYMMKKLKLKWSPELISGRLPLEYPEYPELRISHEAIYQFIYDKSICTGHNLVPYLARANKQRRLRTHSHRHKSLHIPRRVSIKERPPEVQTRIQPGHWEADTLISRRSKAALAVALERTSRHLHLAKLPAKSSQSLRCALTRRLSRYPQPLLRSITYDNGCENVEHEYTNKVLGTQSYFCEPFHSWEKASIENAIGLIRRFFPKKTDFDLVTKEQVKRVETLLNTRPRKCLNYLTPNEVLGSCVHFAVECSHSNLGFWGYMPTFLIVYHSKTGNTEEMAKVVAEGVASAGVKVIRKKVQKTTLHDLLNADGIILGSPTYYGTMAAEMKAFIDRSVKYHGKLEGKVGGAFASGGGLGGGVETTVLDLTKSLLIHGMIVQGDPWGSHYGTVSIGRPDASVKKECKKLGEKVATLVKRLTRVS